MTEKRLLAAVFAALSIASAPAAAADFPIAAPVPRVIPAPIEVGGGWYLRGDVGIGIQEFRSVRFAPTAPGVPAGALAGFQTVQRSYDEPTILGAGIGYQFNEWLRFDLTGEYRTSQTF